MKIAQIFTIYSILVFLLIGCSEMKSEKIEFVKNGVPIDLLDIDGCEQKDGYLQSTGGFNIGTGQVLYGDEFEVRIKLSIGSSKGHIIFVIADNTFGFTNEFGNEDEKAVLEEKIKVASALEVLLESMKTEEFVYQIEGRADPFEPFISEEILQEVAETSTPEKLTGMRQFEPGQLSLVAIMFTESNPMAMVEDSSHKGYIIRRGTKIGKSGVVSDILPNQVVIKQLSYSVTKAKKYKTVEMTLRKEGEK